MKVMAIGDSGRLQLCEESETVTIQAIPLTADNKAIPATVRALPHVYGTPVALVDIEPQGHPWFNALEGENDVRPWPLIRWRDDRGKVHCCYVRNKCEATDVLFSHLPAGDRAAIVAAIA